MHVAKVRENRQGVLAQRWSSWERITFCKMYSGRRIVGVYRCVYEDREVIPLCDPTGHCNGVVVVSVDQVALVSADVPLFVLWVRRTPFRAVSTLKDRSPSAARSTRGPAPLSSEK
jgi:hypothetical protein